MILWYLNHKPGGLIWAIFFTVRNTNYTKLNNDIVSFGIKSPFSGTGTINTYWVDTGNVYYRVVNGICIVYFDLIIKTITIENAVLVTNIPYGWLGVYEFKINASATTDLTIFYIEDNALKCGAGNAGRYFGHMVYPTV